MIRWLTTKRYSPIGVDIGLRSVKLMQFDDEHKRLVDAVRWDVGTSPDDAARDDRPRDDKIAKENAAGERALEDKTPSPHDDALVAALRQAREGRRFRGREAVLCLDSRDLLVQNIRVPKTTLPKGAAGNAPPGGSANPELDKLVQQEAARRVPFSIAEAEIRYLDAADVRQGDSVMREVVLLACHRPLLQRKIDVALRAGLQPVAVDVEPSALLRCYAAQFRRDDDRRRRAMFAHIGASNSVVVIAQGPDVLFVKYIDVGGRHFDEAVARHLKMSLTDAAGLRRHNGDRRTDQQDPEVAASVTDSVRPVIERLANELSLCIRYHSVTFRGQPLVQLVLGGGEATQPLVDALAPRLDLKCEVGDPLRSFETNLQTTRKGQWDVAAGLALRSLN